MTIRGTRVPLFLLLAATVSACGSENRNSSNTENAPAAVTADADNTARNQRDRDGVLPTASDQGGSERDLQISAEVRKAVVDDNSLSVNAHNVKIITNGGVVTLRGPVKDEQEKATVENKARQVAGVSRIDNLLEVETHP